LALALWFAYYYRLLLGPGIGLYCGLTCLLALCGGYWFWAIVVVDCFEGV